MPDDRLRALVFSFHYVLAAGFGRTGSVSVRMVDVAAFPVGRNCGAWSAHLGVGRSDVARSTAERAVSIVAGLDLPSCVDFLRSFWCG